MTPSAQESSHAQPSLVHHLPIVDLNRFAPPCPSHNLKDPHIADASPSPASHSGASHCPEYPPSHSDVAIHTHNAAPTPSSLTMRSRLKVQHVKTQSKNFMGSLISALRKNLRRTRNIERTGILNETTDTRPTDCNTAGILNETTNTPPTDCNTTQNDTWRSWINIAYAQSAQTSDITRSAIGAFDSQCPYDLMSKKFAEEQLGICFKNNIQEHIGFTMTGEPVYSIGRAKARWHPHGSKPLSSLSGSELSFSPKFFDADFYVVELHHYDVIIGHPSLEKNNIYDRKNKMIAPFRSIVTSTGSSAAADAAQAQAHAEAVAAERARMSQFEQQQDQGSSKN